MNGRISAGIVAVMLAGCVVMALVDGVWQPGYAVKSAVKLGLFLALPWLAVYRKDPEALKALFRWDRSALHGLLTGLGVYGLILAGYSLISRWFDFSGVAEALSEDVGVNAGNFLFVALYISLVNSLLEEFFFRGFGYLTLSGGAGKRGCSLFSAVCFAGYHVAMMAGWFSPLLLALLIGGLLAVGLLFNATARRTGALWTSWFLHLSANLAINTIGFILLL